MLFFFNALSARVVSTEEKLEEEEEKEKEEEKEEEGE